MKVAWVTLYDAENPRSIQGRGYYAPRALQEQSIQVRYIDTSHLSLPLKLRSKLNATKHRALHDNRFMSPRARRWYSVNDAPFLYKEYGRSISRQLSMAGDVDIVCGGVSPHSQPISFLDCEQPIVLWTDTTFASAIDFYPQYRTDCICERSIRDIIALETAALSRCRLAIYASEWGAKNAIDRYGLSPERVRVVPFGANLECRRSIDDVRRLVDARPRDVCRLLFVGVDWLRKGGDLAVQIASELIKEKIPTELTVVGCDPVLDGPAPGFLKPLGYVSNATPEGAGRLSRLFGESHFFLMPSRAESFGHVFCEASSFGVPSVSTNVGGIPTAIRNDRNGKTFVLHADAREYARYIADVFSNVSRYRELAMSSFAEYEARLNWGVAGKAVRNLMAALLGPGA